MYQEQCCHSLHRPFPSALRTILLLGLLLISSATTISARPEPQILEVETLVEFDPIALENPESVAVDRHGNLYISLALTGEIRKISPDGTQTTHALTPIGTPGEICFGFSAILGALTFDARDNLYASVNSCDAEKRGVWKVTPEGELSLVARFPTEALLNGIDLVGHKLYVADSALGVVWTVPVSGGTPEVWSADPLLEPDTTVFAPGPNGLLFHAGELYVANSSTALMVAIPFSSNSQAGTARVHAVLPFGCDDFAFDVLSNIYCTTDPANRLLKVSPDGSTEVLLDADDLLDGPTDATFGRRGRDRFNLYITNAAFPFFTVTNRPSLMRVKLNIPGAR